LKMLVLNQDGLSRKCPKSTSCKPQKIIRTSRGEPIGRPRRFATRYCLTSGPVRFTRVAPAASCKEGHVRPQAAVWPGCARSYAAPPRRPGRARGYTTCGPGAAAPGRVPRQGGPKTRSAAAPPGTSGRSGMPGAARQGVCTPSEAAGRSAESGPMGEHTRDDTRPSRGLHRHRDVKGTGL